MSTLAQELSALKTAEDKITGNKVANFAYDDYAYEHDDANGVDTYNVNNHQNIPNGTANILKVNPTILTKGWRAQASAITRMLLDHFLGRCSYNLNKVNDHFSSLLTTLGNYLGVANGIATLDSNGKVLNAQLKLGEPSGIATLDSSGKVPNSQLRLGDANGIATLDNSGHVVHSQLALYKHVITIRTVESGNYPRNEITAKFEHINSSPAVITKTNIVSNFDRMVFPAYWEQIHYSSAGAYSTELYGFTVSIREGELFFEGYREVEGREQSVGLSEGFTIGRVTIDGRSYDVVSTTVSDVGELQSRPLMPVSMNPYNYFYELVDTVTPLQESN